MQVSWCKVEVEVTTPKSVMMASAESQPQDVPPLVVAALNLKTRFNAQVCRCLHMPLTSRSRPLAARPLLPMHCLPLRLNHCYAVPCYSALCILPCYRKKRLLWMQIMPCRLSLCCTPHHGYSMQKHTICCKPKRPRLQHGHSFA